MVNGSTFKSISKTEETSIEHKPQIDLSDLKELASLLWVLIVCPLKKVSLKHKCSQRMKENKFINK